MAGVILLYGDPSMSRLLLVLAFALLFESSAAAQSVDVEGYLARPGVRLLAVEFYASWCKPCVEAVPKWKALQERYEREGLRLVVVASEDPKCGTFDPGWRPHELVCDDDGRLMRRFGVQALPRAFLWSWDGELLGSQIFVEDVAAKIEAWSKKAPRVLVTARELAAGARIGKPALEQLVRGELRDHGKIDVVATKAERAALQALVRESLKSGYDERSSCEVGAALAANAALDVYITGRGGRMRLQLNLLDAEKGCLLHGATARWNPLEPSPSVAEAVAELLRKVRGRVALPWAPRRTTDRVDPQRAEAERRAKAQRQALDTAWENVRALAKDATVPAERRKRALERFLADHPQGNLYRGDALALLARLEPQPLSEDEAQRLAKSHYDYRGEWAGEYEMADIVRTRIDARGDAATAHIEYRYRCTIQRCRGAPTGVDRRTFEFVREGDRWRITKMGGHLSGRP